VFNNTLTNQNHQVGGSIDNPPGRTSQPLSKLPAQSPPLDGAGRNDRHPKPKLLLLQEENVLVTNIGDLDHMFVSANRPTVIGSNNISDS